MADFNIEHWFISLLDSIADPAPSDGYTGDEMRALASWIEAACLEYKHPTLGLTRGPRFRIKPQYQEAWGSQTTADTIVTFEEIVTLSREWEEPIDDLLKQVEPYTESD